MWLSAWDVILSMRPNFKLHNFLIILAEEDDLCVWGFGRGFGAVNS